MQLTDIKIPNSFLKTQPNDTKLMACAKYYNKFGQLDKPITVNGNGYLVDGYVRYLVAKSMGMKEVPTKLIAEERIYVMGRHKDVGKKYWWVVKKKDEVNFINHINVGDKIIVNTKKGQCPAIVAHIVTRDTPPINQKIKTVASF